MKFNNSVRIITFVSIALGIQAISCRKNDAGTSVISNSSATIASPALITEMQNNMRPIISADSYNDLDWTNASMDERGNAAGLLVVKSKSTPGKSLLYLKSNPSMYIWEKETHFLSN